MKTNTRMRRRGQGKTEYIILVALLAIGTIGVMLAYGDQLKAVYGMVADALTGTEAARAPAEPGPEKKTLGDFANAKDGDCSGGVCQF